MLLCLFRWAYHAHLAIPADKGFFVERDGRSASINCKIRDGARLFSYTGTTYDWVVSPDGYNHCELRGRRGEDVAPFRRMSFADNANAFSGGIVDLVKYTVIEIATEIASVDELTRAIPTTAEPNPSPTEVERWAEEILRDFIDWYRSVTNQADVPHPRVADSPFVEIWIADSYTLSPDEMKGRLRLHSRQIQWTPPDRMGLLKPPLSNRQVELIRRQLESGNKLTLAERLLIEAKELSFLRNSHDLAIITIGTAFEVHVRQCLILACKKLGLTTLPTGPKGKEKQTDVVRAVESGRLRDELLGRYGTLLSGKHLQELPEYEIWRVKAYELRNRIVHGGASGFSLEDAGAAFTAVVSYMNALAALLPR